MRVNYDGQSLEVTLVEKTGSQELLVRRKDTGELLTILPQDVLPSAMEPTAAPTSPPQPEPEVEAPLPKPAASPVRSQNHYAVLIAAGVTLCVAVLN